LYDIKPQGKYVLCTSGSGDQGHADQRERSQTKELWLQGCTTAAEIAKSEFKARMTVPLAVAGAFHTDYMSPAVDKLKEALANISFSEPRIPVISNVDSKPHSDPETIKDILSRQVTSPVQWEATITDMLQRGLGQSYEIGPGNVIAGLIKRIDRKHKITNVKA
jgi:[acyl-carrier-protein] S-malonyltransferase